MTRSRKTRKWPLITLTAAGTLVGLLFVLTIIQPCDWTRKDEAGNFCLWMSRGSVGFNDSRYVPLEDIDMTGKWDMLVTHIDGQTLGPLILPRTTQDFRFPGFRWERREGVNRRAARGEKDRFLAIDLWLPAALLMAYPLLFFLLKPVRTFLRTSRRGKKVAQICIVIGIGTAGVMLLFHLVVLPNSLDNYFSWAMFAGVFSAIVFLLQLPFAAPGRGDSEGGATVP